MRPSECESKRRGFHPRPVRLIHLVSTRSYRRARRLAGEPNSTEETFMGRKGMFSSNKSILVLVACICFAVAVLTTAGVLSLGKISWTDLGLFFGFLSFLF